MSTTKSYDHDKPKDVGRRLFLFKTAAIVTLGGYAFGKCVSNSILPWYTQYELPDNFDPQMMKDDLPLLREMMFEEAEKYFSLPKRREDSESKDDNATLEDITSNFLPQVVEATHSFLNLDVLSVPEVGGSISKMIFDELSWSFLLGLAGTGVGASIAEKQLEPGSLQRKLAQVIGGAGFLGTGL